MLIKNKLLGELLLVSSILPLTLVFTFLSKRFSAESTYLKQEMKLREDQLKKLQENAKEIKQLLMNI